MAKIDSGVRIEDKYIVDEWERGKSFATVAHEEQVWEALFTFILFPCVCSGEGWGSAFGRYSDPLTFFPFC